MLLPLSTRALRLPRALGARSLHQLPPMPPALAEGCEPFLSKRTANLLWTQWQAGLLQRLNEEVRGALRVRGGANTGTAHATESVVETVMNTARSREQLLAFSYASLALNNSFFLSGLVPHAQQPSKEYVQPSTQPGAVPTYYGKTLATAIADQFGSLPQLKLAFASAAMSMFSSGFVWLVKDEHGRLGVLPTYGTGTVLVHQRRQCGPSDLVAGVQDGRSAPDAPADAPADAQAPPPAPPRPPPPAPPRARPPPAVAPADAQAAPAAPRASRFDSLAQGSAAGAIGNHVYPLLCVSVFEHAWLGDYGFWGKERYLANFWECINWERAEQLWGEDRL